VNGTSWESGWHKFKLNASANQVSAYIDNMTTPVVTGEMSITLPPGRGGFYVYSSGDYAGYFDDFKVDVIPTPEPTPTQTPSSSDFDILIKNGEIFPGGDADPIITNIGISGEYITFTGDDLSTKTARHIIDAAGLTVVPGFVDAHTHADSGGSLSPYVRQGVTTMVTGNCGGSPSITNVDSYYNSLYGKLGPNYIGLLGHNSLRSAAGFSGTTPTLNQMNSMKNILDNAMQSGSFGMSTGLIYSSGYNSTTEEIIELAKVIAGYNGIYATHMRSEMGAVLEAVDEAVRIGKESGCRVQISHVKCAGPNAWGKVGGFLSRVDAATSEGQIVRMDQYPYTASQTTLNVLFPGWALNNWSDAVNNHRSELEEDVKNLIYGRGEADRIYIISGTYRGKYLSEVATELGKDPVMVMIDDIGPGGGAAVYHQMLESEVQTFMPHKLLMVGSDGPTSSHPRGSGTFPRFWGHYTRDLGMFSKKEAVRKTSTLAAEQFYLIEQNRGLIKPGFFADITIFDYNEIIDRATFDSPSLSPLGIKYVIINGEAVINNGLYSARYSGKVLRLEHPAKVDSWICY
jgi:N-acyl-D-amino-acid deacylase